MTRYVVRFTTNIEVTVRLDAADEEHAEITAGRAAQEYLDRLPREGGDEVVYADASLDGVGAYEVEEAGE